VNIANLPNHCISRLCPSSRNPVILSVILVHYLHNPSDSNCKSSNLKMEDLSSTDKLVFVYETKRSESGSFYSEWLTKLFAAWSSLTSEHACWTQAPWNQQRSSATLQQSKQHVTKRFLRGPHATTMEGLLGSDVLFWVRPEGKWDKQVSEPMPGGITGLQWFDVLLWSFGLFSVIFSYSVNSSPDQVTRQLQGIKMLTNRTRKHENNSQTHIK
jgi:hypothetical protein